MADTELFIKEQRLDYQLPQNQPNPSKWYTQFMYKAVVVAIFLVLLPLLPSQAPEFVNQSFHTRSWELVQVLLVGIAVSYGLFSRKNEETEKEHSSKLDSAQSYVSRLLQVSSVFDDESESSSVSDENKVQTWSSQYFRGEPVVVVARENSVMDEKQSGSASRVIVDEPLVLPVRSLKSRVAQSDFFETTNESSGQGGSLSRSSSKRFSSNSIASRNGELEDLDVRTDENIVLRSPIPWRSRSGRMEMTEEIDDGVPPYSLPPPTEESDFNRLRSQSKPNSTLLSSPKKTLSSLSSESQSKNIEEIQRKKIYYKSSPPPAPPPPPPPSPLYVRKPPLVKSNSTLSNAEVFPEKELKRSVRSVPMNSNEPREIPKRTNSGSRVPIRESRGKMGYVEEEFEEKVAVETDEETESEEEDVFDENEEVVSNSVSDGGKDVDKKADEFIAKFREQIRLQRIESIKRSTGQIARNSDR